MSTQSKTVVNVRPGKWGLRTIKFISYGLTCLRYSLQSCLACINKSAWPFSTLIFQAKFSIAYKTYIVDQLILQKQNWLPFFQHKNLEKEFLKIHKKNRQLTVRDFAAYPEVSLSDKEADWLLARVPPVLSMRTGDFCRAVRSSVSLPWSLSSNSFDDFPRRLLFNLPFPAAAAARHQQGKRSKRKQVCPQVCHAQCKYKRRAIPKCTEMKALCRPLLPLSLQQPARL